MVNLWDRTQDNLIGVFCKESNLRFLRNKKKLTDMWKFALRSTCVSLSLKTQRSIYVDAGNSIFLGAGFVW